MVPIEEIRQTVDRMEQHLDGVEQAEVVHLVSLYRTLAIRFADDLNNERDVLLARASALMLVQEFAMAGENDI